MSVNCQISFWKIFRGLCGTVLTAKRQTGNMGIERGDIRCIKGPRLDLKQQCLCGIHGKYSAIEMLQRSIPNVLPV